MGSVSCRLPIKTQNYTKKIYPFGSWPQKIWSSLYAIRFLFITKLSANLVEEMELNSLDCDWGLGELGNKKWRCVNSLESKDDY